MRLATAFLIACAAFAQVQESSDQRVIAFLQAEARRITDRAGDDVASRAAWEKVRARRLEELRDMLGLLPWPARTPLNVRVTGVLERADYIVEKVAFESMPKFYVTANLYVPKTRRGGVPAIVYVCGHSYSPAGSKAQYQRHGISLARNGYVAIILDAIQLAETYSLHHGAYSLDMFDWFSRGYSPAGVEVWNAMRAIDYLETRPEVDASRIGMTGRSGGAAMSWFTAAVDPRVKAAIPVMGISTYAANVALNTQKRHCDCMFPVNTLQHDLMHLAALIAPRPLLMAHGRQDDLFPMPGVEEVERRMGALYRDYGRGDDFRNIVVETGHQDSDYLREQAIRWFDRHLLGQPDRALDMKYENAPAESLAVFPNGAPKDGANHRVHETFLPTPAFRRFPNLDAWNARREDLLKRLRGEVFSTIPRDAPVPELRAAGKAGSFAQFEFEADPGAPARLLLQKAASKTPLPAILYIASDGDDAPSLALLLNSVHGSVVRAIVYPRGVGETGWTRTVARDVMRNAMHTGRTTDSMRLWDVLQALRALRADPAVDGKRVVVAGKGAAAGLAVYAALLDPAVEQVVLFAPPSSHVEGPHFLNVLRYTDLPEAVALLAPRRVWFYNRMPSDYEAARGVFGLYGKPSHLGVTMSLAGPVLGRFDNDFASGI